uniref:EF-hand domain-containing protein n=1 Tax=Biomphalaria glabrata TaxID=6526 RepID=A0A2C9L537_BIOGL
MLQLFDRNKDGKLQLSEMAKLLPVKENFLLRPIFKMLFGDTKWNLGPNETYIIRKHIKGDKPARVSCTYELTETPDQCTNRAEITPINSYTNRHSHKITHTHELAHVGFQVP